MRRVYMQSTILRRVVTTDSSLSLRSGNKAWPESGGSLRGRLNAEKWLEGFIFNLALPIDGSHQAYASLGPRHNFILFVTSGEGMRPLFRRLGWPMTLAEIA